MLKRQRNVKEIDISEEGETILNLANRKAIDLRGKKVGKYR